MNYHVNNPFERIHSFHRLEEAKYYALFYANGNPLLLVTVTDDAGNIVQSYRVMP